MVVVGYGASGKEELKQVIVKFNFVNYVFAGKDTVMTVNGKKDGKDYLRFDEGENILYRNRYLISSKGCILDLQTREVLRDAPAKVVKLTNDSVIYFINDVFSGSYYSLYNLTTRLYSDISQPDFKPLVGQNVEIDQKSSPYKLIYFPKGKPKAILMDDAGHGGVSTIEKKTGVPVYWIDDNSFMFPYIKITDLEGSIVKYDLNLKTQKTIGSFSANAKIPTTFTFNKINNALVEFSFKDKYYLINPIKETMLNTYYKDFEYNYSISTDIKPLGRTIYHKGIEIGKNYFELHNFKASNNHAAIICNIKMGGSATKRELSVYSVFKAKWENIYVDHLVSIAGWIIN
ncbi:MAG: hypothetical protein K0S53_1334 [Bacteroidetes bacterium]|nr:hypothetical protein [Bacteroidota bacterium]